MPDGHAGGHGHQDDGPHLLHRVQVCLNKRPGAPREQPGGLLLEQKDQQRGERVQRQRGGGPGQDQPGRAGCPAGGEREHQAGRQQSADGRQRACGERRQGQTDDGGQHDGEMRSRVDAQRVRGGQRVACERLQERTGHAERQPDGYPGEHAREPGRGQDVERILIPAAEDQAEDVQGIHRGGTLRDVHHGQRDAGRHADREQGRDPQPAHWEVETAGAVVVRPARRV